MAYREAAVASSPSPSKLAYRKALVDATMSGRILAFRARPVARPGPLDEEELWSVAPPTRRMRRWRIPKACSRKLEIPYLDDDFCLNLLDWGSANVLVVALDDTVVLWDDSNESTSKLASANPFSCPVTSLCWAPDGRRVAVGLDLSQVQLWNSMSDRLLRTLYDVYSGGRVTSLAWKDDNILAMGGIDGDIHLHDLRLDSPVVQAFYGHTEEVCDLNWSGSAQQLASGGDDNMLHIWDISMSSSHYQTPWLYRMGDHTSTVKALAWCPFESNLLASGGGGFDCCIKFWNTSTGCLMNSVDTGSQVCSLPWNRHGHQLISSDGAPHNQLAIWKYPSMAKAGELTEHSSQALFTAQSSDGYTLVSASADESLAFWKFSTNSEVPKPKVSKTNSGLFSSCSFSHIR